MTLLAELTESYGGRIRSSFPLISFHRSFSQSYTTWGIDNMSADNHSSQTQCHPIDMNNNNTCHATNAMSHSETHGSYVIITSLYQRNIVAVYKNFQLTSKYTNKKASVSKLTSEEKWLTEIWHYLFQPFSCCFQNCKSMNTNVLNLLNSHDNCRYFGTDKGKKFCLVLRL
jgi:hypothetical protein